MISKRYKDGKHKVPRVKDIKVLGVKDKETMRVRIRNFFVFGSDKISSASRRRGEKKLLRQKIAECMAGEVYESEKDDHMSKNSKVWRVNLSLV
jgi:S-adenosylmethionine synthetase